MIYGSVSLSPCLLVSLSPCLLDSLSLVLVFHQRRQYPGPQRWAAFGFGWARAVTVTPRLEKHPMKRITRTIVSPFLAACVLMQTIGLAAEKDRDWKPLMDGKTLNGWHPVGQGK